MTESPDPTPLAGAWERYLDALLLGRAADCQAQADALLAEGLPVADLYVRVMKPALYRIGEMWSQNLITVAHEQVATAITEGVLASLYPDLPRGDDRQRRAVVSTLPGELHQVGAKMVCDFLEMRGWEAVFLGADVHVEDILAALDEHRPHLLGLSLSIDRHVPALLDLLPQVHAAWPSLAVVVGGQGVDPSLAGRLPPGVAIVTDLEALRRLAADLERG